MFDLSSIYKPYILTFVSIVFFIRCSPVDKPFITLDKDSKIMLIGGNLCSRMMSYGPFETHMHQRFPTHNLIIRNMCDGGDTPGFRPHSGRNTPWAFPGAEDYQDELAHLSGSEGHLEYPDEWLTRLKADIILAFFGYSESFEGLEKLPRFKNELTAFIKHTQAQHYNGVSAPQLILCTPIAFENLSTQMDVPDGRIENGRLATYANAILEVGATLGVPVVDLYEISKKWYSASQEPLTVDGSQLNKMGYDRLSEYIAGRVFSSPQTDTDLSDDRAEAIHDAVMDKNWIWHNDYKMPNGVHVFGRRYNPFGPDNYPAEIEKLRQMTDNRDTAIWMTAIGQAYDLVNADLKTRSLPAVESNFIPGDYGRGESRYLYGQEALDKLKVAPGYKIELFASEKEFKDLANPVQLSFDNKGRLWVATMPTYPHWKPGDPRPNDKIIILEDTDGDGLADRQTTFAEGLHLPVGFEMAPEGVYVSQGTNLKLLIDDDNDDKADREEIILSGFDDHDTHHVISAFCADPSGAIYMGEGVFLHTNVETSYGTVRATNGGFYRYNPQRKHLERTAQLSIPNPWGIAFDDFGQHIFAETSGPAVRWMMPGSIKPKYGVATHKSFDLIEEANWVRPTSGLEFVSSRHFPEEVQGDLLINNTIGFLGTKQHKFEDSGTGYKTGLRQDLITGSDPNFRPVDMEFAPDGSLYVVDWHNVLIGHMQHNARDPMRDHAHGRIYRVTYPSRPLLTPAKIDGASIETLLDNLTLYEYRTRYRTRRELRGRNKEEVLSKLDNWIEALEPSEPLHERHLLEALWVQWGLNAVDENLLRRLLSAKDYHIRAAAVRVLRYSGHQMPAQADLLMQAANDEHGRVRLEAIVAASWLEKEEGLRIVNEAGKKPLDEWMINAHVTALASLNGEEVVVYSTKDEEIDPALTGDDLELYKLGKEIYEKDGYCITCHQTGGKGLVSSGFPPLATSQWVTGDEERLIKLTLHGLYGPITVLDVDYPGLVPMTAFGGLLDDREVAGVLTFVRKSYGNTASIITEEMVAAVRKASKDKKGFYTPEELLKDHPME